MGRRTRRLRGVSLLVVSAACNAEPSAPRREPEAAPASAESIPAAPVNGALRGQRFTLGPACYVIDRRPGYEHADIVLSMGTAATPCGPVAPRDAASVWFRHRGATRVDPEQVRIQPDAGGARLLLPLRRLA